MTTETCAHCHRNPATIRMHEPTPDCSGMICAECEMDLSEQVLMEDANAAVATMRPDPKSAFAAYDQYFSASDDPVVNLVDAINALACAASNCRAKPATVVSALRRVMAVA